MAGMGADTAVRFSVPKEPRTSRDCASRPSTAPTFASGSRPFPGRWGAVTRGQLTRVAVSPESSERRSPCRAALWNRLLDQFIAIPSGNLRDDHGATLILTVRLRPGTMKNDRSRQSLQLGFGQRIAELLAVCSRAGALHRVDGRLQGLIPVDRIDCRLLRKTLVVGYHLLHQGVRAPQIERYGPVDASFDFAIGQVPIRWILKDPIAAEDIHLAQQPQLVHLIDDLAALGVRSIDTQPIGSCPLDGGVLRTEVVVIHSEGLEGN